MRVAIVAAIAGGAPVAAATIKTSFGVSATVIGSPCRILPGRLIPCAPIAQPGSANIVDQPLVRFSRDPRTGVMIETIEF
jgi:hypothetical protein